MNRKTLTVDIDILARMRSMNEFQNASVEELIRLIRIGMAIIDEDDRLMRDQGILRSHYHLPWHQKKAIAAAARYRMFQSHP